MYSVPPGEAGNGGGRTLLYTGKPYRYVLISYPDLTLFDAEKLAVRDLGTRIGLCRPIG